MPPIADDPALLARVRALLAKAESTPFEAEAQAFTAKAHELMARHSLTEALVVRAVDTADGVASREITIEEPYVKGKVALLGNVARTSRCRVVVDRPRRLCTVVGFPADLGTVELLFTSLLVQAQVALHEAGRGAAPGALERSRRFRSSFLQGYAVRIGVRLEASQQATESSVDASAGGALVPVLARRRAAVDTHLGALFPRLRRMPSTTRVDGQGWEAGYHAAGRADLGQSAVPLSSRSRARAAEFMQ